MAELGKIEKPGVEEFAGRRKLYCVPNVAPAREAPGEYGALVAKFWEEVAGQLERIEAAGRVRKIFFEGLWGEGEEPREALNRMNEHAYAIVKKKIDEGARLLMIEREEIIGPFIDWRNCLHVIRTREVMEKVFEFYHELL